MVELILSNDPIINVSPTISRTYWVRAEEICNTTNCISITILIGYKLSGNFYYKYKAQSNALILFGYF